MWFCFGGVALTPCRCLPWCSGCYLHMVLAHRGNKPWKHHQHLINTWSPNLALALTMLCWIHVGSIPEHLANTSNAREMVNPTIISHPLWCGQMWLTNLVCLQWPAQVHRKTAQMHKINPSLAFGPIHSKNVEAKPVITNPSPEQTRKTAQLRRLWNLPWGGIPVSGKRLPGGGPPWAETPQSHLQRQRKVCCFFTCLRICSVRLAQHWDTSGA